MAQVPQRVEIRSYQVGFGDCFLLSFVYPRQTRNVLIDFGSTCIPTRRVKGKPNVKMSDHMRRIAGMIERDCGKDGLAAVIATHRHADHINGFGTDGKTGASGKIIRDLKPRLVLQPWTEDPDAATDATQATRHSNRSRKSVVGALASMHRYAQQIAALANRHPRWMSSRLQKQLSFLGEENIANRSAIDNLIAMGERKGARAVWAHHGSKSGLERLLPGVKIHVLGPPSLQQSEGIRKMRAKDPDQFWHLVGAAPNAISLASSRTDPETPVKGMPFEARWFRDRLRKLNGEQLLEIVRTLDQQMNNTSLILLFEVFGRKLLFPGDAQIENWNYALQGAPNAAATRQLLADVDVYKVGHHGSLNATPKKALWQQFRKRKGKKLHTLLSTMKGKHGTTDNETEVPRRPLVTALATESRLKSTLTIKLDAEPHKLTVTRDRIR